MIIRVISVPDFLGLPDFDEVFRPVLGWDGLGFIFRFHGEEFNSFRRATRSKTLREFQLRPRETFLYTCGAIDLWEWGAVAQNDFRARLGPIRFELVLRGGK